MSSPPPASPAGHPIVEDVIEEDAEQELFSDAEELFPNNSTATNDSLPPSSASSVPPPPNQINNDSLPSQSNWDLAKSPTDCSDTPSLEPPSLPSVTQLSTVNAPSLEPPSLPSVTQLSTVEPSDSPVDSSDAPSLEPPSPLDDDSLPSTSTWAAIKVFGNLLLNWMITFGCGILQNMKEYKEQVATEAWNKVTIVFEKGKERYPDRVGPIWTELQAVVAMYPPEKLAFLSYFRLGVFDLENPGNLLVHIWNYVPISSYEFSGFLMKIIAGVLMLAAPTFWLHYQIFFAFFVTAKLCEQCLAHCPLLNFIKIEMVPGIHDTKTYDDDGGRNLSKEKTCDDIPPKPLGCGANVDWERVVKAHRAAIPVFLWLLAEVFEFKLFIIGYGNHVRHFVSKFFGEDLLDHDGVHVEYCMHTSAFFYNPVTALVDHFVKVHVKSNLFLKGDDWKNEEAVDRDYNLVRPYFDFARGFYSMIPCECIELEDDETYKEGATFVYYDSTTALAKFLGCSVRNVRKHIHRGPSYRGVVTCGNRKYYIRHIGSDEDFPRVNGSITYQTIVLQRVKLNGNLKLTKVGEREVFPYLQKAVVFLEDEERGEYKMDNARNNVYQRLGEGGKMSTQDTIPAGGKPDSPRWIVGRSIHEVEFNIENVEFYITQRGKAKRKNL